MAEHGRIQNDEIKKKKVLVIRIFNHFNRNNRRPPPGGISGSSRGQTEPRKSKKSERKCGQRQRDDGRKRRKGGDRQWQPGGEWRRRLGGSETQRPEFARPRRVCLRSKNWWTDEISELRKELGKTRRADRSNRTKATEAARRDLRRAISVTA